MGILTGRLHVPAALVVLAFAAEFPGCLGLVLNLSTRVSALGLAVNMLVAVGLVHARFGFFMNWYGQQPGGPSDTTCILSARPRWDPATTPLCVAISQRVGTWMLPEAADEGLPAEPPGR